MPPTPTPTELALVTVAVWPPAWSRPQIVEALVESIGINPADAQLLAPVATPTVIAVMETTAARDAVRVLRSKRVGSLAIPVPQLAALQPALLAKRLVPAVGAPEPLYMVEPWRGEGRGLRMRDVILFVRGRIPKFTKSVSIDAPNNQYGGTTATYYPLDEPFVTTVTEMRGGRDEALDIYTAAGPPIRITGRFDFGSLLGKDKGYSDADNMDRTAVKLGDQAPAAMIDLGFKEFKPPRGIALKLTASTASGTVRRDDTPLFEFYSAWISVVQAAIRASPPPRAKWSGMDR